MDRKKYMSDWRASHPNYYREYQKSYKAEHREQISQYFKEWREKNKERLKQKYKEWREKNQGKIRAYRRAYCTQNGDKIRTRMSKYNNKRLESDPEYYARRMAIAIYSREKRVQERLSWDISPELVFTPEDLKFLTSV